MPDTMPVRPPLQQALDEDLAAMFRSLQAEPAPATLIRLADRLDAAWRSSRLGAEARTIA